MRSFIKDYILDLCPFVLTPSSFPCRAKMKLFLAALAALTYCASARMAYQFSSGYLDILGAEPIQNFDCANRAVS